MPHFLLKISLVLLLMFSVKAYASPQITISYDLTTQGFTQIKITNETRRELACYVAIDGHKERFILTAMATSKWYKATDTRFKYTDFSVFCDYIEYIN
jgi:hypothetical protein